MKRYTILTIFIWFLIWSPKKAAVEDNLKVFFGNLHSHTSYSDGSGTPDQAYKQAREVAKLDFLAITEHNHKQAEDGAGDRRDGLLIATNPKLYNGSDSSSLINTALRHTKDGQFIALYGQEFSSISSGNHVNVFEVSNVIDVPNGQFDRLLSWISQNPDSQNKTAIIQFNHPGENRNDPNREKEYGADDFGTQEAWIKKMGEQVRLIEIVNGPALSKDNGNNTPPDKESEFLHYLQLGFHVAPTGDQDNHYFTWGTSTDVRTGVITDQLTKSKLLDAIRSRHVYATEDKNLKVIFKVNGNLCGDQIPAPTSNSPLKIEYQIEDADEPDASYHIDIFSGVIGGDTAKIINSVDREGNTATNTWEKIDDVSFTGGEARYMFFRITQEGADSNDRAWTAPIWFDQGISLQPNSTTTNPTRNNTSTDNIVASKNSSIYHISRECKSAQSIKAENVVTGEEAKRGRTLHVGCPIR